MRIRRVSQGRLIGHRRQSVPVLVSDALLLARLDVALDLRNVALAEHLRVFDQLVADLGCPAAEDERILVLAQLRLQRAYLQVHLALVPCLVHLLRQELLDRNDASRLSTATQPERPCGGAVWRDRGRRDR